MASGGSSWTHLPAWVSILRSVLSMRASVMLMRSCSRQSDRSRQWHVRWGSYLTQCLSDCLQSSSIVRVWSSALQDLTALVDPDQRSTHSQEDLLDFESAHSAIDDDSV